MSNTNDTSDFGRAPQVRELRDDELQEVSGGYTLKECMISGVVAHVTDGTSNTIAFGW
jgi:bacteriocin-like protein